MIDMVPALPCRVTAGIGSAEKLAELPCSRPVLVLDEGARRAGLDERLPAAVREKCAVMLVRGEPTVASVQRLLEDAVQRNADAVIGLGGGSALDTAKAVALLMRQEKPVRACFGQTEARRNVPLACVPTTAGTGSESTCNIILLDELTMEKQAIISRECLPDLAILDPAFTASLPPTVAAFTGVDALCHCVESLISRKANPISRAWSREGICLILQSLENAVRGDVPARMDMLWASFLGGAALTVAGTCGVHALAYPLGGRHVPHGVGNSALFRETLLRTVPDVHALVPEFDAMNAMILRLPLPTLADYPQVVNTGVDELVREAVRQTRLLDNHPAAISPETAADVYRAVLHMS